MQDVDGLKPSKHLIKTAKRNIEGEITANEARQLVDAYYEVKDDHDIPEKSEEADKVAARINQIIHTPAFRLSPEFYLGLHGKIFEGVFPHAGKLRDVDLTKKEWVLNGDTVQYEISFMVQKSLEYDFEQEKKFKYKGLSEDAFVARFTAFISGIWQIHPFREGNTRTTAVFAIKYLRSKGYEVSNDLFRDKSFLLCKRGAEFVFFTWLAPIDAKPPFCYHSNCSRGRNPYESPWCPMDRGWLFRIRCGVQGMPFDRKW